MDQEHCNRDKRYGKYLTENDRHKLEAMLKLNITRVIIAEQLGKDRKTITREIKRGQVTIVDSLWREKQVYSAEYAQQQYLYNASNKGAGLKIGKDHKLAEHIEKKITEENYSPAAVIGEIKAKNLKFKTSISIKTVYNYVDKGIFLKITNKDLPEKGRRKNGNNKPKRLRISNPNGKSIEERPAIAEDRKEYGHWEMDCVVSGKKTSLATLLVMTERKTREELIMKMKDKTQISVIKALDVIEEKYKERFPLKFKTITVDNGSEFLNHEGIERSSLNLKNRTAVYYAHAYSSWERGSNENANKLIRRFIPKGSDIGKYTNEMIERIQHWINNYPRKIFNYKSTNGILLGLFQISCILQNGCNT